MLQKLTVLGLALFVNTLMYAQPGKNVSKAIKAAASFEQSAAYQAALRHAQAIRTITTTQLVPNQPLEQAVLAAAAAPIRHTRKSPQARLDELENFITQHGHFPRPRQPQENNLYQNSQNLIKRLGPQHPITLRIQGLKAQTNKRSVHTPRGWLYELEDFITANNHYPALGNSLKENQLYFELDNLINTLKAVDPVCIRIRQIRAQYGPGQETKE